MTTEERFERIERVLTAIAESQVKTEDNVDRITAAVGKLADTVATHDSQIEQLLAIAEENQKNWRQLHHEWQAYLRTIRPQ
jgi:ABC-type transporter Mla subunit MlaD